MTILHYVSPALCVCLASLMVLACVVGALKQRVELARAGWTLGALSLMLCGSAWAGPDSPVVAAGMVVSRDSLILAGVVCGLGAFVQAMTILAEGIHRPFLQHVGSVALAGVAGSLTTLILQDQFKSPFVAIGLGVGVAYMGGAAVLKKLGANALTATNAASKDKKNA
jgi:hypothetical protein